MVDRQFSEAHLVELYDRLDPPEQRDDFGFYLPMIMAAKAVLDVGCGTGALLHRAREAGHVGRLVGLDPAKGMLEVARTRSDIEWILGDLSSVDQVELLFPIDPHSPTRAASHSRPATR